MNSYKKLDKYNYSCSNEIYKRVGNINYHRYEVKSYINSNTSSPFPSRVNTKLLKYDCLCLLSSWELKYLHILQC